MSSLIADIPSLLTSLQKVAATATPDEREVEKAFAEQAYTICANKAGPLMDDEHRVGFETVDSNEDLTKILALWVYRLGRKSEDQLVMVPCMFINGRVLGTDMMYRAGPKKMVPHTPDWCRYLVDLSSQENGKSHPKSDTGKLHPLLHADRFMRTPSAFGKQGSDVRAALASLAQDMQQQTKVGGVLRDFIERSGVGLQAIDAMTGWIAKSAAFGRAIALRFPPEQWMPETIATKEASVPNAPILRMFFGTPTPEALAPALNREKVAAEMYKQGYSLEFDEKAAPDHSTVVYDGGPTELRNVSEPGQYTLMTAGGSRLKAAIGKQLSIWDLSYSHGASPATCFPDNCEPLMVVALEPSPEGATWSGRDKVWALAGDTGKLEDIGVPLQEASADDLYCLVHPDMGEISSPAFIVSKKKTGEVWHLQVGEPGCSTHLVVVNPDARTSRQRNVLDGKWRAVRVPHKRVNDDDCQPLCSGGSERAPNCRVETLSPAGQQDIRASITKLDAVKEASVSFDGEDYRITLDRQESFGFSRKVAHVKLAAVLQIHPDAADNILTKAAADGRYTFWMEFSQKMASRLQIVDAPFFEDSTDPIHQVAMRVPQSAVLGTVRDPIFHPQSRIGDKYDPLMGTGERNAPGSSMEEMKSVPSRLIMEGTPDDIAKFAEVHQLPHVFDHGIFSTMAKTYDSQLFLDQYLVKIEDGLDSLGRCLFLYYWKPQDWKQLYGQDDLTEIEDKLLNAFKSTGDILLDLLKKSRNSGTSPA